MRKRRRGQKNEGKVVKRRTNGENKTAAEEGPGCEFPREEARTNCCGWGHDSEPQYSPFSAKRLLNIFKMIWYYTVATPQGSPEISMCCVPLLTNFKATRSPLCAFAGRMRKLTEITSEGAKLQWSLCWQVVSTVFFFVAKLQWFVKNRHPCHSLERKRRFV